MEYVAFRRTGDLRYATKTLELQGIEYPVVIPLEPTSLISVRAGLMESIPQSSLRKIRRSGVRESAPDSISAQMVRRRASM